MFAKWRSISAAGVRDSKRDLRAVAEENERLKFELENVKLQLDRETSLLEEEKSLVGDDEEDILARYKNAELARKTLQEENEALATELYKARKQIEGATKTLKLLSSAKVSYGLLNPLLFPPLRNYTNAREKKAYFQPNWRQVAALAAVKNCADSADVIVFYQCGNIFGLTRDAKSVVFRAKIDSTICHAVVDEKRGLVYYSAYFFYPGIYSVPLKQLEACRSANSVLPKVKTDTLLECPHWIFRGLAVDAKQDWLYACGKFSGTNKNTGSFEMCYKVGVWGLASLAKNRQSQPLFYITYDEETLYLNQPFQPYYCAVYRPESDDSDEKNKAVLAVSDWRNSNVHLFDIDVNEQSACMKQTVASVGSASSSVAKPCAVQFDRFGNLLVAESGNRRVQLFSPVEKMDAPTVYESRWMSETYKSNLWSLAVFQADDFDEPSEGIYSEELCDTLYVGLNYNGKVACLSTPPCF